MRHFLLGINFTIAIRNSVHIQVVEQTRDAVEVSRCRLDVC